MNFTPKFDQTLERSRSYDRPPHQLIITAIVMTCMNILQSVFLTPLPTPTNFDPDFFSRRLEQKNFCTTNCFSTFLFGCTFPRQKLLEKGPPPPLIVKCCPPVVFTVCTQGALSLSRLSPFELHLPIC